MSSWLWTVLKMFLFVETFCTLEEWVGRWEVGWGRCHLYRSWTQSQNVAPRETMKKSRKTNSTKIRISYEPVCVSSCRRQSRPSGMLQVVLPPLPPWQTQEEAWVDVLCFTICFVLLFFWYTIGCFTLCWTLCWPWLRMLQGVPVVIQWQIMFGIPPLTWDPPAGQRLAKDLPLVEPMPQKPSRADLRHSDQPGGHDLYNTIS